MTTSTITLPADGHGRLLPLAAMQQADLRFEAKDYVGCAAWLREAITLRLDIMLFRYDVKPPRPRGRKSPKSRRIMTPMFKVQLLLKAGVLESGSAEWVSTAIETCNKLIHLCYVPACRLSFALGAARLLLDDSDDPTYAPRLFVEGGAL